MANKKGAAVDTTCLSLNRVQEHPHIHRDYLAHCFRWSHVVRYLGLQKRYQTAHILDVGCGKEVPLAKTMWSMMQTHTTGSYTAVDYGPIKWPHCIPEGSKKFKLKLLPDHDFAADPLPLKAYDLITCFEVLEHVEPLHAWKMMKRMHDVLENDGICFLSTPCFDPRAGAAANHVNEMSFAGFRTLIHLAGFGIENVWGTFASQKDYKKTLPPELQKLFGQMSEYYDSDLMACFFAPVFPFASRNCLWKLSKKGLGMDPKVLVKDVMDPRNSSSGRWQKDLKSIVKQLGGKP